MQQKKLKENTTTTSKKTQVSTAFQFNIKCNFYIFLHNEPQTRLEIYFLGMLVLEIEFLRFNQIKLMPWSSTILLSASCVQH